MMFKKIRRAFIKLCNKRSIDVLDDFIRFHDRLSTYYETFWDKEPENRHYYYRHKVIMDTLQNCKQIILCEEEN